MFRCLCKTNNYYSELVNGEVVAGRLQELDGLCESLTIQQIQSLNERLRDAEDGRTAVEEAVSQYLYNDMFY